MYHMLTQLMTLRFTHEVQCGFYLILTVNSDYIPKQLQKIGLWNVNVLCFLAVRTEFLYANRSLCNRSSLASKGPVHNLGWSVSPGDYFNECMNDNGSVADYSFHLQCWKFDSLIFLPGFCSYLCLALPPIHCHMFYIFYF